MYDPETGGAYEPDITVGPTGIGAYEREAGTTAARELETAGATTFMPTAIGAGAYITGGPTGAAYDPLPRFALPVTAAGAAYVTVVGGTGAATGGAYDPDVGMPPVIMVLCWGWL